MITNNSPFQAPAHLVSRLVGARIHVDLCGESIADDDQQRAAEHVRLAQGELSAVLKGLVGDRDTSSSDKVFLKK